MATPAQFLNDYAAALETQDWAIVAPLIHDDCVAVFTEDTFIGKVAVEGAFRKTFALIAEETYKISAPHWIVQQPTIAVVTFNYNWTGIIHGKVAAGGGRGTSTLVNEAGRWQLISEHLGPNPRK